MWNNNGEWRCPGCGTIIGKNLRGQQPFALVEQHKETCAKYQKLTAVIGKAHALETQRMWDAAENPIDLVEHHLGD